MGNSHGPSSSSSHLAGLGQTPTNMEDERLQLEEYLSYLQRKLQLIKRGVTQQK